MQTYTVVFKNSGGDLCIRHPEAESPQHAWKLAVDAYVAEVGDTDLCHLLTLLGRHYAVDGEVHY